MASLKNKTIVITGASRGIGRALALRCARDGANIVVAAKTLEPHPKLPGTIETVAAEIVETGARALAIQLDVRDELQVQACMQKAATHFGGIDILVNNAGAIKLLNTEATTAKYFDLMMAVNTRATFLCTQAALPYLEKSSHAHVLNMSPPLSLDPKWLKDHVAYSISKYGMSFCTLGMATEFKARRISVNSLWPKTAIDTAAIAMLMGEDASLHCRKPDIMADAAYALLSTAPLEITGELLLDEDFLRSVGTKNFEKYACAPGNELFADFYVN